MFFTINDQYDAGYVSNVVASAISETIKFMEYELGWIDSTIEFVKFSIENGDNSFTDADVRALRASRIMWELRIMEGDSNPKTFLLKALEDCAHPQDFLWVRQSYKGFSQKLDTALKAVYDLEQFNR